MSNNGGNRGVGGEGEKKNYSIALVWEMWGRIDIEAHSEEEAIAIALADETALPEGNYVDSSVVVDVDAEIEVSDIIDE